MTDFEDFYDIAEYVNEKAYLGNQIVFGDYETGAVYTPFEKERNIAYGGVEWPVVVVVEVAADVSDSRCELPFSCKRECRRFDTAAWQRWKTGVFSDYEWIGLLNQY